MFLDKKQKVQNYLSRKDPFLQVGDNTYNIFADAIADAIESGETIVVFPIITFKSHLISVSALLISNMTITVPIP